MRYGSPDNPMAQDINGMPFPVYSYTFGYNAGSVPGYVNTNQSMSMNGSIYNAGTNQNMSGMPALYAPESSYMGAYALVMQQDAFRASLVAGRNSILGGTSALANSHVDTFIPTYAPAPTGDGGTGTGAGNGADAAAQGRRYSYVVNNDGTITYKKPDGTNCDVTEFRREAGEQAFRDAQAALRARQGQS